MRSVFASFLLLFFILSIFPACSGSKDANKGLPQTYRTAFYNVENLFDTLDHPDKIDDDFTPTGRQEWNTQRYHKKLNDLCRVIAGMEFPSILGVCEVENPQVLQDFIDKTELSKYGYQFVHFESPDRRGIDVALLYRSEHFKVSTSDKIRIPFPEEIAVDYTSRDILHVEGLLGKNTPIHVFVNHWPSRRGGLRESEPKRTHVAQYLRDKVDLILAADPEANILIMGDLNDETDNKSVKEVLGAHTSGSPIVSGRLYNCTAKLDQAKKGSYNYRGNWNMLDNMIVSSALARPTSKAHVTPPTLFQREWMMYQDPKYGAKPSRTYGGPNYYGGFSDHLPVFMDIVVK